MIRGWALLLEDDLRAAARPHARKIQIDRQPTQGCPIPDLTVSKYHDLLCRESRPVHASGSFLRGYSRSSLNSRLDLSSFLADRKPTHHAKVSGLPRNPHTQRTHLLHCVESSCRSRTRRGRGCPYRCPCKAIPGSRAVSGMAGAGHPPGPCRGVPPGRDQGRRASGASDRERRVCLPES